MNDNENKQFLSIDSICSSCNQSNTITILGGWVCLSCNRIQGICPKCNTMDCVLLYWQLEDNVQDKYKTLLNQKYLFTNDVNFRFKCNECHRQFFAFSHGAIFNNYQNHY